MDFQTLPCLRSPGRGAEFIIEHAMYGGVDIQFDFKNGFPWCIYSYIGNNGYIDKPAEHMI